MVHPVLQQRGDQRRPRVVADVSRNSAIRRFKEPPRGSLSPVDHVRRDVRMGEAKVTIWSATPVERAVHAEEASALDFMS